MRNYLNTIEQHQRSQNLAQMCDWVLLALGSFDVYNKAERYLYEQINAYAPGCGLREMNIPRAERSATKSSSPSLGKPSSVPCLNNIVVGGQKVCV